MPNLLIERFVELYTPYQLLPLGQSRSIAAVLADMMKEEEDADNRTDNRVTEKDKQET
jgi:hypothetical protein